MIGVNPLHYPAPVLCILSQFVLLRFGRLNAGGNAGVDGYAAWPHTVDRAGATDSEASLQSFAPNPGSGKPKTVAGINMACVERADNLVTKPCGYGGKP